MYERVLSIQMILFASVCCVLHGCLVGNTLPDRVC
jgi:hypothetical protein